MMVLVLTLVACSILAVIAGVGAVEAVIRGRSTATALLFTVGAAANVAVAWFIIMSLLAR